MQLRIMLQESRGVGGVTWGWVVQRNVGTSLAPKWKGVRHGARGGPRRALSSARGAAERLRQLKRDGAIVKGDV